MLLSEPVAHPAPTPRAPLAALLRAPRRSAPAAAPALSAPDAATPDAATITAWGHEALIREVTLSPKPGLVDRWHTGAHRDMDIHTFRASAAAIAPWLAVFFRQGRSDAWCAPTQALAPLRPLGLACEADMRRATSGVNTHKGSIFALGLLAAAAGRLDGRDVRASAGALCEEVAAMCEGLVQRELAATGATATAGERLYQHHGLGGARAEAASGFATARQYGLQPYRQALARGLDEETALHAALLQLLAYNQDTNLVARGGLAGLQFVQARAQAMLAAGGVASPGHRAQLLQLDHEMIERNLSPGGSADLLAVSWFLARFPAH